MAQLDKINEAMAQVTIVLVAPRYAENVGAAARVACNMGISRLALVRDSWPDQEAMARMATHHASHLLEKMELHPTLAQAVAPCQWVVATSARRGRQRQRPLEPRELAADLLPRLAHNRVALVFGPEHRGLTNDDLSYCNSTLTIPTADFSSLNLAQAVAIVCHELFSALWNQDRTPPALPRSAPSQALQAMYDDIGATITALERLDDKEVGYWLHNLKQFFNRVGLRGREVRFIHGLCRQVLAALKQPKERRG
ncbi:MAG: RNA methyltransferase [Thermodesulfobacteriota bacterium]